MRAVTSALLGALIAFCVGAQAQAQDYPQKSKTIRIIVSYPPGAANDFLARLVGQKLSERWSLPVVVDNRPGANGMIGADLVAKAPPDGYTLWLGTDGPAAINKSLYKSMPYDPVKAFAPLSLLARYQLVLVTAPSLNVNSVSEFVEKAKQKPSSISFGSPGIGSQHHLSMELLGTMTGAQMVHVPYKGSAAAVTALLGGEVQSQFVGTAIIQPYLQKGTVKALAVSSGVRSPVLPDLPTISESGLKDFDISAWFGLLAPAGTPRPIVDKLNAELAEIIKQPDVREKMLAQGLEPDTNTPEQFSAMINGEITKWAKIIQGAKLEPLD